MKAKDSVRTKERGEIPPVPGRLKTRLKKSWQLHVLVALPILLMILFGFAPMTGLVLAWKKYIATKGIFGSPWVGWQNFSDLFNEPLFWPAMWNTLYISCLKLIIGFPVPILVALLLNEVHLTKFKKIVQTLMYLPYFLSWVVLSGICLSIFELDGGVINRILEALGLGKIYWYGNSSAFIAMLVITEIWKNFGYGTIVYLAALTGIDKTLYEAAAIDGASRWKQTLAITIPGIMPIAMLMAILNLGSVLNAGFDQIFMLINPLVSERAMIIDVLVYDMTFQSRNYGIATALSMFRSVISFILIVSGWYLAHKFSDFRVF